MRRRFDRFRPSAVLLLLAVASVPVTSAGEPTWPQWGGPNRDFRVEGGPLSGDWPESGPPVLWRRELGPGYSAIVSDGKLAYTLYRRGDQEVIAALETDTGRTRWEYAYHAVPYPSQNRRFGSGPNATPLLVGDRIYAVGFTSKLHALDRRTGKRLWSYDLVEQFGGRVLRFGYSSSPLVHEGRVIVLVGGERHGAIGFDVASGQVAWRSEPIDISYASPIRIDVDGDPQLAVMTPTEVLGIGLDDGRVRWRHPHASQYQNNCAGPWSADGGRLLVSSQGDIGSQTLELRRDGDATSVARVARNLRVKISHTTAVVDGDWAYASSGPLLLSYDLRNGRVGWKERSFPNANVVGVGDQLLLLDEDGELALAAASPESFRLQARSPLLQRPARTVPTVIGTRVLLRDEQHVVALDLTVRVPQTAPAGR